jgi:hypothetical protein
MKVSQRDGTGPQCQSSVIGRQSAFLAAYAECVSIKAAAKAARVNRRRHYKWLETDPDYRKKFKETQMLAAHIDLFQSLY